MFLALTYASSRQRRHNGDHETSKSTEDLNVLKRVLECTEVLTTAIESERTSRQVVQTSEREGLSCSSCLQTYPAEQEVWVPGKEQGPSGSLRSTWCKSYNTNRSVCADLSLVMASSSGRGDAPRKFDYRL